MNKSIYVVLPILSDYYFYIIFIILFIVLVLALPKAKIDHCGAVELKKI